MFNFEFLLDKIMVIVHEIRKGESLSYFEVK